MLALNHYRTFTQTGEHAAFRPTRRPPRTDAVNIVGTKWYVGTEQINPYFAPFINASAVPKDDGELRSTLRRVVADGYWGICLRSATERVHDETLWNWGTLEYDSTDAVAWATLSNRTQHKETLLVQMDKMIAWGLDEGLECIYIDIEAYAAITERGPNARPLGTYQGRSMQWSDEWRDLAWDHYMVLLDRTNTITGEKYFANKRIIWKFNNEAGFSHGYITKGTQAWSGGSAVAWFDKIVDNITDTGVNGGANGYWYTELCAKLATWAASPTGGNGWVVPNWGRGSTGVNDGAQGFPKKSVLLGWVAAMGGTIGAQATTDKNNLLAFVDDNEMEYIENLLTRCRALRSDMVVNTGTWTYTSPRTHIGLPPALQTNVFAGKHHYFDDAVGTDNKSGSCIVRKSVMDATWSYADQGGSWYNSLHGAQASYTATLDEECGQYSPNRWYYQRMAYQMILACLHGRGVSDFSQSQQYLAGQFYTDGRFSSAEHAGVANPCHRYMSRAVAPAIKWGYFSEFASVFQIYTNKAGVRAKQAASNAIGFNGNQLWASYSGLSALKAHWGGKKILFDISESETPTLTSNPSFTGYPSVSSGSLAAGYYVVSSAGAANAATEAIYLKTGQGLQGKSRYCCVFIDTITETPAFTMPMSVSSMSAAVSCAFMFLRSDTKIDLFTGPMKLYIFGSAYDTELVTQGGGPGEAAFMTTDEITINYFSGLTWTDSVAANTRLMMPEAFTVNLDTTNGGLLPAGTDLEIFGVTMAGVPVRLDSSYNSGTKVWTWRYDPTVNPYAEYTIQPKVTAPVRSVRGMRR